MHSMSQSIKKGVALYARVFDSECIYIYIYISEHEAVMDNIPC